MYAIVVYDVQVERIDSIRQFLKKYLYWIQNSVFEGELTLSELEEIKEGVGELVDKENDHILIYLFRNVELVKKVVIGTPKSEPSTIV